jgi:hypothetical protein
MYSIWKYLFDCARLRPVVIVLAESKAVREGGLRLIRDRGGTLMTHVTSGGSYSLVGR